MRLLPDSKVGRTVLGVSVLVAVLIAGVAVVYVRQGNDRAAGARAAARQAQVYPTSCKVYVVAQRKGWIDMRELAVYLYGQPKCPAVDARLERRLRPELRRLELIARRAASD